MAEAMKRWVVDISKWHPATEDFLSVLSLLPRHEHSSITKYVKWVDRKRALVGRLLQYAIVHQVMGIPIHEIIIKRTIEGKPYLDFDEGLDVNPTFPNFNFNVSHHGDLVAIASEPFWLVGVDIVSHHHPIQSGSIQSFLENFSPYFSSREWDSITSSGTSDAMLEEFRRCWSLKEAFLKAIGCGLVCEVNKVEVHHDDNWTNISISVDGEDLQDWRFWHFEPRKGHYISVAQGNPIMAAESFKKTLRKENCSEDEHGLDYDSSLSFEWLTLGQLISMFKVEGDVKSQTGSLEL